MGAKSEAGWNTRREGMRGAPGLVMYQRSVAAAKVASSPQWRQQPRNRRVVVVDVGSRGPDAGLLAVQGAAKERTSP